MYSVNERAQARRILAPRGRFDPGRHIDDIGRKHRNGARHVLGGEPSRKNNGTSRPKGRHHRSLAHEAQGLRERMVRVLPAPGTPFDHAIFEIVVEPLDAPLPERPWEPADVVASQQETQP